MSQDTFAVNFNNPLELNRYVYTANNPINASDPSGHTLAENGINWGVAVRNAAVITAMLVGVYVLYGMIGEVLEDTEPASEAFQRIAQQHYNQNQPTPQVTVFPPPVPWRPTLPPQTTPQPTETPTPCDSQAFTAWWFSLLPVPESIRPDTDWYEYEQRVASGAYQKFFNIVVVHLREKNVRTMLNYLSNIPLGTDSCADDITRAGFPLIFFEEGGFAFRSIFNLPFLLLDIFIGLDFAVICGFNSHWLETRNQGTAQK